MATPKKEEKKAASGSFPMNAVTPVGKTYDQRLAEDLEKIVEDADKTQARREKRQAHHTFDSKTKQHIQSVLQSVIEGKAKFRATGRRMTGADEVAFVRHAMESLNAGLPAQAKGLVRKAADALMDDDNPNFAELAEFARMASIDIANRYTLDNTVDQDSRSTADIVADIPRF